MLISIIIPTYKPQAYIWECLNSIYNQTFSRSNYELILVLNGCHEPYHTQIINWISEHPELQVQYYQTDEGGVSNARNIALDNAKGEYVTFIDDDDLISPTYLEELYEKAAPDTVSLCYPYAFNDGKIEEQLSYTITEAYNYCISRQCKSLSSRVRKFFSGPCMKLIPMSFIQGRRFDVRFKNGEDSLYMFLISDKIHKLSFTSRHAIYYRRFRENSATTTKHAWGYTLKNGWLMACSYTLIFFAKPFDYSFILYVVRLLGVLKTIIVRV